mmetsp:Transcript_13624/g.32986  ORF Transcript_13624/g.32986 Transcript_13624/m.32986 type:complete len:94 (+) Transcript_13624:434-715(+)
MRHEDVVLGASRFETSPEGVEEGGDSIEHIGSRLSVRKPVVERSEFVTFRFRPLYYLWILIIPDLYYIEDKERKIRTLAITRAMRDEASDGRE